MSSLRPDVNGNKIQGFAPYKIVEVTGGTAWVPGANDVAFRVGVDDGFYIGTVSARVCTSKAGSITVINKAVGSYTFTTTQEIEVM